MDIDKITILLCSEKNTPKNYYFLLAKFTAEDLELLRLFEIESAANYLQRIEEEKRTGTEERVRRTSER